MNAGKGNSRSPVMNHDQFWRENEKMERVLEEQLRELKSIDITIDNIVNE